MLWLLFQVNLKWAEYIWITPIFLNCRDWFILLSYRKYYDTIFLKLDLFVASDLRSFFTEERACTYMRQSYKFVYHFNNFEDLVLKIAETRSDDILLFSDYDLWR